VGQLLSFGDAAAIISNVTGKNLKCVSELGSRHFVCMPMSTAAVELSLLCTLPAGTA